MDILPPSSGFQPTVTAAVSLYIIEAKVMFTTVPELLNTAMALRPTSMTTPLESGGSWVPNIAPSPTTALEATKTVFETITVSATPQDTPASVYNPTPAEVPTERVVSEACRSRAGFLATKAPKTVAKWWEASAWLMVLLTAILEIIGCRYGCEIIDKGIPIQGSRVFHTVRTSFLVGWIIFLFATYIHANQHYYYCQDHPDWSKWNLDWVIAGLFFGSILLCSILQLIRALVILGMQETCVGDQTGSLETAAAITDEDRIPEELAPPPYKSDEPVEADRLLNEANASEPAISVSDVTNEPGGVDTGAAKKKDSTNFDPMNLPVLPVFWLFLLAAATCIPCGLICAKSSQCGLFQREPCESMTAVDLEKQDTEAASRPEEEAEMRPVLSPPSSAHSSGSAQVE